MYESLKRDQFVKPMAAILEENSNAEIEQCCMDHE